MKEILVEQEVKTYFTKRFPQFAFTNLGDLMFELPS